MSSSSVPCRVCPDDAAMFSRMRAALSRDASRAIKSTSTSQCPPDATALGHAGWTLLHTIAQYYPLTPSRREQSAMAAFIGAISLFYPCAHCAEHLQSFISERPLDGAVVSRDALARYWCEYHNEVNAQNGKPQFDCAKLTDRYGGPEWSDDGTCQERENKI